MNAETAREYDAAVAGYIGVDMAPGLADSGFVGAPAEILRPGGLVEVGDLTISLGGAVANTGLALSIFGKRVALMALIGEDVLGDVVLRLLEQRGLALRQAQDEGVVSLSNGGLAAGIRRTGAGGTAYGIVIAPPGGDRAFMESPGCNRAYGLNDIDYDAVGKSRLFHFGYPTLMRRLFADGGVELANIFARARELGAATSLDMTLPDPGSPSGKADWRGILTRVLPHVDIFVPSVEEILYMMVPEEYARIARKANGGEIIDAVPEDTYRDLGEGITGLGVAVLLIKAGHRGAYLRTGDVGRLNATTALALDRESWSDREIWVPAFLADADRIENASGAGDVAVAGLLAGMLDGASIERAGKYAMLAGRDNLYGADALGGLSDWETMTDALMSGSVPVASTGMQPEKFEFCEKTGVWNAR